MRRLIISHQHRFIFLKTRKTAGTSIEIALSKLCGADDVITKIGPPDEEIRASVGGRPPQNYKRFLRDHLRAHHRAKIIRAHVGARIWDSYYKFTIERNPFDKAISRYWWALRKLDPQPTLSEFLAACRPHLLSNWTIYTIRNAICVDHVIRYENLAKEMRDLSERLGVEVALPEVRSKGSYRTDRRHYSEVLSANDRQLIESVCANEIAAFGYEWTPVDSGAGRAA